jgi:hypothetical protein
MSRCLLALSLLVLVVTACAEPSAGPILIKRPEAFQTLVNPTCSHCVDEAKRRSGELRKDDRVLAWIRGYSNGGAIPIRFFLNPYRVISDTYGVFVYDPDAGYARGFAPSLDFRFHGWRNGVMVMRHKDGTLYSCLTGIAFDGPRKGDRLKTIPTQVTDWGDYLERYPGGVAYKMFEKYQPTELPTASNLDSLKSRQPADPRLPGDTPVLGVITGKSARAYPLEKLARAGVLRDTVDGQEIVVLWYAPTRTASAFRPLATPAKKEEGPPRSIVLEPDGKETLAPFLDRKAGVRWDIAGRAVDGSLKGWTLDWLDSAQVKWFAWAAEHPDTSIYGTGK